MRLILYGEQKDRLYVLVMWTLKFSCESNQTPRFRALFTIATLVSPTVRVPRLTLLSCWRVTINVTSVLFSLSFSLSACIHALMARIHCSMACTASASRRELSGWRKDKAGYRQQMHVRWAGTARWPRTACWHRHWRVGARDTDPEEHQMARDNNLMSLHSATRTGYVQVDTMRTMQEQHPWCQMRSRIGVTAWHGRQCRTPHSDRAIQEFTRVAYSCWTKYHLQLSVVLFPCCALSYKQTEAQETVCCQSCDYTLGRRQPSR